MVHCCVALMAYNEEGNIGRLLEALCAQRLNKVTIDEIVVVASGCTDRTEEIVRQFCARDARVRLLSQGQREGKASAVNYLLRHISSEVVVLQSADTLPTEDTIEHLVAPFEDAEVGMTGGRPVPTNDPHTFMGYVAHLLWRLHHRISLRRPKMGELIAFRNIFRQIPYDSAVDEASIEPLILGQGLKLRYVPEAIVYNHGPETITDFFKQRRRIYAGHLYVKDTLGYKVATMSGLRILVFFLQEWEWNWRYFLWGPAAIVLEVCARLRGAYDYKVWKRKPFIWAVAETTKELTEVPQHSL
ncbi:MAG: glycosyltransferase [Anaerolineae bacterium]|nr:glycosyltransferase [Anaerolineae bacterium]